MPGFSKKESRDSRPVTLKKESLLLREALQLHKRGSINEAEKLYLELIRLGCSNVVIYSNLGVIYSQTNRCSQAFQAFQQAIQVSPKFANAYSGLANICLVLKRYNDALAASSQAVKLDPKLASAHLSLAQAHSHLGKPDKALTALLVAIQLQPANTSYHLLAGKLCSQLQLHTEAIEHLDKVINVQPDCAAAFAYRGTALYRSGQLVQALESYQQAFSIDPSQTIAGAWALYISCQICDWRDASRWSSALARLGLAADQVAEPWMLMALEDRPDRHLVRAHYYFQHQYPYQDDYQPTFIRNRSRIRVGYFSSDIYAHATMVLLAPLLTKRNADAFEIYVYSYNKHQRDVLTEQVKGIVDVYRDMGGASDDILLSTARSDQLDIAIDLKGFTKHARLSMFAKRVAPLQVSFLGYPGSMGSKCYDYLVADRVLIPESERQFYSERILYMPNSYQPNTLETRLADHSLSRAELGLPDNCFVFASFNASYKIQPAEFGIWMNLLRRIPNSVIWIYASCDLACHNLSNAAVEQGVSPKRLIFASSAKLSTHLARMQSADLFLDTFNVNAHTTAADALSVGVPVLTKPGRSLTARVCASLLTALEMPELIANDETDYEDKAFYYATKPSAYHVMRLKLSEKRDASPLFDADAYVQAFENGLSRIYLQALQNKISDTSAW